MQQKELPTIEMLFNTRNGQVPDIAETKGLTAHEEDAAIWTHVRDIAETKGLMKHEDDAETWTPQTETMCQKAGFDEPKRVRFVDFASFRPNYQVFCFSCVFAD